MKRYQLLGITLLLMIGFSLGFGNNLSAQTEENAIAIQPQTGQGDQNLLANRQKKAKKVTDQERRAAALRFQALVRKMQRERGTSNYPPATIKSGVGAQPGIPHYFGPYPNWANSLLPRGPVGTLSLDAPGSGYTAPVVTITDLYGIGTGATATATADPLTGAITAITLGAAGSDYAAPVVAITDPDPNAAGALASAVITGPLTAGTGIRKFVDKLPGLTSANQNLLGQYLPVAVPNTTAFTGCDYYEIELQEYTEKLHPDLAPTRLRGYVQVVNGVPVAPIHYLGPIIVANRNTPVRIKFTNKLPIGPAGDLFIPVDTTVMGSGMAPDGTDYKQNRGTLHLHGGLVPWISDGTPHQWTIPVGESSSYPRGVATQFVPDMWFDPVTHNLVPAGTPGAVNDPGPGSMTFYYNNQQSARLMFYHDHSLGITRLNVYAGEAAGYVIQDQVELDMIYATNFSGVNLATPVSVLPDVGIPLIIQDKTFVDPATINYQDPTWVWGPVPGTPTTGDLWYPHVYMTAQNPADITGTNAFGRWHYGPWFWPPTTGITYGPVPNPYYDGINPWEPPLNPGTPNPSTPGEGFLDTPLVNGHLYPYLEVEPRAYRFRVLNACNDRMVNLQLYKADPAVTTVDGRTLTEVKMVPAFKTLGYPPLWPTDGRPGGVPDPTMAGPQIIQIGTEGGFLPAPVVLPNQPIDYNYNPTTFTYGNVTSHTLLLGSAERADIIIDFSAFAGQTLILYNDAPAALPAGDPRNDYYTGDPDNTSTGGAPTTIAGFGPNIRTIMQFKVGAAPVTPYNVLTLKQVFAKTPSKRGVFEASQDPIIIPEARYNSAYNGVFPADTYIRIADTAKTFKTISGATITINLEPKGMHDEMGGTYDIDYGRMSAMLGLQNPNPNSTNQQIILSGYASPPVDLLVDSVTPSEPLPGDGTQIWKISHNGVDTHTIHFHLCNVQLINSVGWDGIIYPFAANELGWKETVRVNPLSDTIVAMRPIAPTQPFKVPNSVRLISPTELSGAPITGGVPTLLDPSGNAVTVTNHSMNFGYEYVYHCHILAHEEMDMMHALVFAVAPPAPSSLNINTATGAMILGWTDNSGNETGFTIQRALDSGFTTNVTTFTVGANINTYRDTTAVAGTTYYYRVTAKNTVGDTAVYPAPAIGFPNKTLVSAPSNTASGTIVLGPVAPSNVRVIAFGQTFITIGWNDNSNNETGFQIRRARTPTGPWTIFTSGANTTSFNNTGLPRVTQFYYQVRSVNAQGNSAWAPATPLPANTN